MKLTPQDVQSLKDTSKWAGFTYTDDSVEGALGDMQDMQNYQ